MILMDNEDIALIASVAKPVVDGQCNCVEPCTCMRSRAREVLEMLARKEDGQNSPQAAAYRKGAMPKTTAGEIEVDDEAIVSFSEDGGSYVQAWIWVENEDAGVCRNCGAVNADNGEGWDGLCGNCADKAEPPQSTTGGVETPIQRATRWVTPEAAD